MASLSKLSVRSVQSSRDHADHAVEIKTQNRIFGLPESKTPLSSTVHTYAVSHTSVSFLIRVNQSFGLLYKMLPIGNFFQKSCHLATFPRLSLSTLFFLVKSWNHVRIYPHEREACLADSCSMTGGRQSLCHWVCIIWYPPSFSSTAPCVAQ